MKVDIYTTENKYDIIYADPPWNYNNKRTRAAAEKHYCTMKIDDIKKLLKTTGGEIASKDCVLFMWATMPVLKEALDVIKAWGFEYKTAAFCWVKQNEKSPGLAIGLGNWTRSNAELCLLATRGHPRRISKSVKQIVLSPRGRHSEKPAEVRDRIVQLMGDLPRIELFARQHADGWDCWGNEV